MQETLTLSRGRLSDFLACQRRFQLRYQQPIPWPTPPLSERGLKAQALGWRFHDIMHRHFLGLSVQKEVGDDPQLYRWWRQFSADERLLPAGRRIPEVNLTVPIGDHFLTGRIDLLILDGKMAHIFDWKTGARPRPESELRADLQTTLYLAMIVEGAAALNEVVDPDKSWITYWNVNDSAGNVTFSYSRDQHAENWSYLRSLVDDIEVQMGVSQELPLTGDLNHCGRCAYQIYCGRQMDGTVLKTWTPEESPAGRESQASLEPNWR